MGRPQKPLERDGSPAREFAFWLRDLRHRSGLTYEQVARSAHYATSTMQAATTGQRLPTLKVTMAFVTACGGDEGAWRAYWVQARRLLDEGAPSGLSHSVASPWAAGGARAASQQPVGGWYVESFTALLRRFELRIRFGDSRPPTPAWVVRAAPPPVIYRGEPTGERLDPDRFGDISVSFTGLRRARPG